ncbi:MAG: hypothetical protein FWG98_08155 [Candidatus Cloacimonetes bacterium]|nr:hypothetical protein [Candidatus Cloacimonadota bacterium]
MTDIRFEKVRLNEVLVKVQMMMLNMHSMTGGNQIIVLLKNERHAFPYFYLENQCKRNNSNAVSDFHDFSFINEVTMCFINSPILMSDEKTIREVEKRLRKLELRIEIVEREKREDLYDLQREKEFLIKYLAEVLTPRNKIKFFEEYLKKSKKTVQTNIKRFLDEMSLSDPELSEKIRKLLVYERYTVRIRDV